MKASIFRVLRFRIGLAALASGSTLFAQAGAGTAWVRHGPAINGTVEGSLQLMTGESATLNGGAAITGDLLVPGTPTLKINGSSATFGGTLVGTGSSTPAGYTITLNGNSRLGTCARAPIRSRFRRSPPRRHPSARAASRSTTPARARAISRRSKI